LEKKVKEELDPWSLKVDTFRYVVEQLEGKELPNILGQC